MKTILRLSLTSLLLTGCVASPTDEADFRAAIPSQAALSLETGSAESGRSTSPLIGQSSDALARVRLISGGVNEISAKVYVTIALLSLSPAAFTGPEEVTFGPVQNLGSPKYWMVVKREDPATSRFSVKVFGQVGNAAAKPLLYGESLAPSRRLTRASVTIDGNALREVEPIVNAGSNGLLSISYEVQRALGDRGAARAAEYTGITAQDTVASTSRVGETLSRDGYEFRASSTRGAGDAKDLAWSLHVRTRLDLAGRGDYAIAAGGSATGLTATECWGAAGTRTYFAASTGESEGSADACAFPVGDPSF